MGLVGVYYTKIFLYSYSLIKQWNSRLLLSIVSWWGVHFSFLFFLMRRCDPTRAMASSFMRFLDHTQRRITVDRTPLDEWSARSRDLYLTTHNTQHRQISMPPVGFEPAIPAIERLRTHSLDRAATGTDSSFSISHLIFNFSLHYLNNFTYFKLWRWNLKIKIYPHLPWT